MPCSPASCSSNDEGGSTATPSNASSSCSNGCGAGVISIVNQAPDNGSAPCRIAGSSPALTALDLPLPLGPTTAMNRPPRAAEPEAATSRSTRRYATEEVDASTASNARSPLYGFTAADGSHRGANEQSWLVVEHRAVNVTHQVGNGLVPTGWIIEERPVEHPSDAVRQSEPTPTLLRPRAGERLRHGGAERAVIQVRSDIGLVHATPKSDR